jgi:tetratricopeptide (TPR) repeat protein
LIEVYCKDTTNIQSHLDLAKAYYDIKQYASAVTYLNRIAEMSDDSDIIYESLCLASQCFSDQGNRSIHVKVCLYHAISVLPDRPEAYFLLSRLMEIEEAFQCYSYCVVAQSHKDNAKRVTDLPFEYDYYRLLFQKAVNAWHAQKIEESKEILYDLHIKYPMDEFYNELVVNNLNQVGWPEKKDILQKPKLTKNVKLDSDTLDLPKIKEPKWSVTKYPTLEITTVIPKKGCVVDCVFCPQEILKKSYNDEMRYMKMDDFKKAIDKVPTEVRIIFSGFIEPFMSKLCTDMILYAYEKGHPIAIFTTAVGMTLDDVERIKHIPFDDGPNGGFTLHLPDAEHLAKHPVTKSYIKVLEAIKKANLKSFYLMSMGKVDKKILDLNLWNKEDIHIPQMWSRAGNLRGEASMKPELRRVAGRVSDATKYNEENYKDVELTCGCIEDLYHNILLPNGDVSLCCMDYGLDHITGNLYEQSFEDAIPENNQCFALCRSCENAVPVNDKNQLTLGENAIKSQQSGDFYGPKKPGKVTKEDLGNLQDIIDEPPVIKEKKVSINPWGGDVYTNNKKKIEPIVNDSNNPTIVVVDNFLDNPDEVRELALSIPEDEYIKRGSVGLRSIPYPYGNIYRPIFEKLLGIETVPEEWGGDGGTHGCFQWSPAETGQVIHCDATDWAGIIFLTPDAPPKTGTWLMKHKETGKTHRDEGLDDVFIGNEAQWDINPFEKIDDIGNVYNRLILWNGRHLHTAGSYFGESIQNSRLYQVFFFSEKI